jgi:hypothetical protein
MVDRFPGTQPLVIDSYAKSAVVNLRRGENMKTIQVFTVICTLVLFCGLTLAQDPVVNIDPKVHYNLYQAQSLVVQANHYVAEAQKINNDDMQGHAEKARDLLVQANKELKAAAQAADAANAARKNKK